ncbi:hypothetical protein R6Q57_007218 [Mikania cordata]
MGSSTSSHKMNTRGVCRGTQNGYGGILRDENGFWNRGFMGHLQSGKKRIDVELWAFIKGIELIDTLRLQNTTMEIDSSSVFDVLENPELSTRSSFLKEKISDCHKLIKKNGINLTFITPEHNKCANFLANLAMEDDDDDSDDDYDGYEDVLDPPPGIEFHIMAGQGQCDP